MERLTEWVDGEVYSKKIIKKAKNGREYETVAGNDEIKRKLAEYEDAEEQGRLVILSDPDMIIQDIQDLKNKKHLAYLVGYEDGRMRNPPNMKKVTEFD